MQQEEKELEFLMHQPKILKRIVDATWLILTGDIVFGIPPEHFDRMVADVQDMRRREMLTK